jgi:thymidylate synthase
VIEALKDHPDTRRTVIQIFDHADLGPSRYKDVPCTCTLQFLLRDDLLHLVVNMRSNDAYIGLPHDVFAFTMLQELVARSVGADVGRYVHMVASLHLYDENAEAVAAYLQEGWQSTLNPMPPMPDGDPWPSVAETLSAEARIRQSVETGEPIPFRQISLPQNDYWADLVRVLAAWVAEKKLNEPEQAAAIRAEVVNPGFREFL